MVEPGGWRSPTAISSIECVWSGDAAEMPMCPSPGLGGACGAPVLFSLPTGK